MPCRRFSASTAVQERLYAGDWRPRRRLQRGLAVWRLVDGKRSSSSAMTSWIESCAESWSQRRRRRRHCHRANTSWSGKPEPADISQAVHVLTIARSLRYYGLRRDASDALSSCAALCRTDARRTRAFFTVSQTPPPEIFWHFPQTVGNF